MKRTSSCLSAVVVAAALGSLTACGSGGSSAAAPAAPPSSAATAAPAASTAPSSSASTETASTGTASTGSSCPTGAATSVPSPVTDAKSARDALLAAACSAPYDGSSSADGAITTAWQKVAPNLTPGLFADSAATPTTIASTGSFLLDYGKTMDQLFAFGVTDGTTCAGGVAVIPQTAPGKASDTKKPTVFASVDVPSGQTCDAETVQNTYRPGSVHP